MNDVSVHLEDGQWQQVTFGDVKEGDVLPGPEGQEVQVLRVHERHVPEDFYRVELEDGTTVDASGNHLWYIETSYDRALHKERLKQGEELLGVMLPETRRELMALADFQEDAQLSLVDMVDFLETEGLEEEKDRKPNPALRDLLIRVVTSIGHVTEQRSIVEDLETGEEVSSEVLKMYSGRLFAQQLLALSDKEARQVWPVIVGRVVTTRELLLLSWDDVDVPVLQPQGEPQAPGVMEKLRQRLGR